MNNWKGNARFHDPCAFAIVCITRRQANLKRALCTQTIALLFVSVANGFVCLITADSTCSRASRIIQISTGQVTGGLISSRNTCAGAFRVIHVAD
jgi:hypothetical protein